MGDESTKVPSTAEVGIGDMLMDMKLVIVELLRL